MKFVRTNDVRSGVCAIEGRPSAADSLDQYSDSDRPLYSLAADERAVVREALARTKLGAHADEADVDATLRRPWG